MPGIDFGSDTGIVIDDQEVHSSIASQLLKNERIFAAMQGMLAMLVWQQLQSQAPGG